MLPSSKQPESKIISIIRSMTINIDLDRKLSSSQFIRKYWDTYTKNYGNDNVSINGGVFEELIAITLQRKGILPFLI